MSKIQNILASQIIKEQFGQLVESVVSFLLQKGDCTLKEIVQNVQASREEVKKGLVILIQHNLVIYRKKNNGATEYQVQLQHILKRKRFQKYVYFTKLKHGDVAELIIETILLNGCDTISRVSKVVWERLNSEGSSNQPAPNENIVFDSCKNLIKAHFLKRIKVSTTPEDDNVEKCKDIDKKDDFLIPTGIGQKRKVNNSGTEKEPSQKKAKISSDVRDAEFDDDGVYWHANFDQMEKLFCDQLITEAVSERFDTSAGKIVSVLLRMTEGERTQLSEVTRGISIFDMMKELPSIPKLDQQEVNQYLSLLSDEEGSGFLSKTDDAAGGMYCVNIQKSVEMICQSACSTVVMERFGSKACRVFRLLLQKKLLEQKQIGELAMIPFKEVKELLYKLFEENFLKIHEVSKAKDYIPSRSFYLFGVDMPQVARLLLNRSYQAMANLMLRRSSQMEENKRLLEKNEKIDGILAALTSDEQTEQVLTELEELITPSEKEQLEKLKADLVRLEQGEIQVEDTVFILLCYLQFH